MSQLNLPLKVVAKNDDDGLEMGVLSDGRVYLNLKMLAAACGVAKSAPITQMANWREGKRTGKLARMLLAKGITRDVLHEDIPGSREHAYLEDVALVVITYYAQEGMPEAQRTLEALNKAGLRLYVYNRIGYVPGAPPPVSTFEASTRSLLARLVLNSPPSGYFNVFREMAELALNSAQHGLVLDEHVIMDISVGSAWAAHWKDEHLEEKYGPREKYPHVYPDFFPQSKAANIEAFIYPVEALPAFRIWRDEVYIPMKLPNYLSGQVARGTLAAGNLKRILKAVEPKLLPRG